MSNIKEVNEIIGSYTSGEATLEQTNTALAMSGSNLRLEPGKNEIKPGEESRFGLLDTGTGTLDKVEIEGDKILNCDCGDMAALCHFGGKLYTVKGDKLVEA